MIEAGNRAFRNLSQGPDRSFVILVHAPTRLVLRADILQDTAVVKIIPDAPYYGGQHNCLATLLPFRYCNRPRQHPVTELAFIAASAIQIAHDCLGHVVDGLDVAIFQDATEEFEFSETDQFLQVTEELDLAIESCMRSFKLIGCQTK